jgi:hypothetical protein
MAKYLPEMPDDPPEIVNDLGRLPNDLPEM